MHMAYINIIIVIQGLFCLVDDELIGIGSAELKLENTSNADLRPIINKHYLGNTAE